MPFIKSLYTIIHNIYSKDALTVGMGSSVESVAIVDPAGAAFFNTAK